MDISRPAAWLARPLLAALTLAVSVAHGQTITYGDSVAIGNGRARTWVEIDDESVPLRFGLTLTAGALANLPPTTRQHSLEFPMVAVDSFFTHMLFDWNPSGHPPVGVYNLPHFDFHFYMIPSGDRQLIPGGTDSIPVPQQYMPQDYFAVDGAVVIPQMGVHYADSLASEHNGGLFTATLIYGFYQAEMLFVEPMITRDYLLSHPQVTLPIKQPSVYQRSAYYPTTYGISHDGQSDATHVTISDFVLRQGVPIASEQPPSGRAVALYQNAPNPFRSGTTIAYELASPSQVRIEVFDMLGRRVATLVDAGRAAGRHVVTWNATGIAAGSYVYRLSSGGATEMRRMTLLR